MRFGAVGLLGTAFYYLVLLFLVEALGVAVMVATCSAFTLVVGLNYVLHHRWTFRSPVTHRRALIPFGLMSLAGFGINSGVMAAGITSDIHYLLVQALALILVVAWNFTFTTLIFSQPAPSQANPSKGSHHGPA